jgi:NOL1/NOP2/fmu family ribosome biogenesis protein
VPWVGNGWVQLTHEQLWVGYGYSCQAQCKTLLPKQCEVEVGGFTG